MSLRHRQFPDFREADIPACFIEAERAGTIKDCSWGNDAAPSFCSADDERNCFVFEADPAARELDCPRFIVQATPGGQFPEEYQELYAGDDPAEALRILLNQ